MRRHRVWIGVLSLMVCLAGAVGQAAAATGEPIRVGFMAPLSGMFAQAGKDMLDGLKMYFEEIGYQAAGRKIELIEEDDEGNNATAVAKYRKLVGKDRIHVLAGVLLTNIGYALYPMIEKEEVPALFLTTPDDLTKRRQAKWMLRLNFSASQPMHALGDYAYKTLGYRRVASLAMDNSFGHEGIGGLQKVFEDNGGKVVQKLWAPLNAQDFAPYITQLRRDVDAVATVFVAAQAVRFFKQYAEYGLKGKVPLIGSGVTSEDSTLRALTDEAEGYLGALIWGSNLPRASNRQFVKAFTTKHGKVPSYFSAVMYSGGHWIAEGAKKVNGNVEDRARFFQAIKQAAQGEDIRGPIRLDEWGNPTQNVYLLKVEKAGGKLQNAVAHTFPLVSQFWTYKPDDFLKEPAYTRDYPPVKP